MRWIGTVVDNPGLESSVATFIDGVYRSRSGVALSELGEVERIEVLRGPQGTLFGRNTSAGLINIITRKPEYEALGNAELTYGNYDYWRAARSEEHTSELQSLMRHSYAVFCLKKTTNQRQHKT